MMSATRIPEVYRGSVDDAYPRPTGGPGAADQEEIMAYDEGLAERLRDALADRDDVAEKRMFGGIAFMVRGHMTVGVVKDDLCARVGPQAFDDALALPGARPMDFTGRPMKGWIFVAPEGVDDAEALDGWVARTLAFTTTLPAK